MADKVLWKCPDCQRTFRVPAGRQFTVCPDCERKRAAEGTGAPHVRHAAHADDASMPFPVIEAVPPVQRHRVNRPSGFVSFVLDVAGVAAVFMAVVAFLGTAVGAIAWGVAVAGHNQQADLILYGDLSSLGAFVLASLLLAALRVERHAREMRELMARWAERQ